jgi:N-acetylglucosamine kinase
MKQNQLILGIDGGGTNTVCRLTDLDGRQLAHVEAPASNHRKADLAEAGNSIRSGIRAAIIEAGFEPVDRPRFAAVCAGLAGVDTQEDVKLLSTVFRRSVETDSLQVLNDGEIALAGALEDEAGVLVISGTGSIAWAQNAVGHRLRVGGWDYILADEGSGYNIGSRILRAVAAAHDRRTAPTVLTDAVLDHFRVRDFEGLLSVIYHEDMTPQRIASLAPLADHAVSCGDLAAVKLITEAAFDLAALTLSAARLAGIDSGIFPVVGVGGVLRAGGFFATKFKEALLTDAPYAQFRAAKHPPVEGAIRLAIRSLALDMPALKF